MRYLGDPEHPLHRFKRELRNAALNYAERGRPVFPVGSDKRPLVKWKDGATTNQDQIYDWWQRWPLAMIGMPTGARSGLVVLDIDRKNGVDGLANLLAIGIDPLRLSPVVATTPSGGLHVYFAAIDEEVRNSASVMADGVDVRGDGGFIVLPPSRKDPERPGYAWDMCGGGYV
ncbi:bifunctional DNA primase/polymerase [Mangrovicoccus sp. HB161399]|uniref:bifunctional DNA primase/polymerase n=1 Tax=Mangrovicoccus sp. HB161399 TaxID=2720392 RepID=UPI001558171A|nr:bifunctional DNA primase/polymerase [Mangrovicoccus sp. HB161399]